jgi:tetratricopeptide (TPR) repeat protein
VTAAIRLKDAADPGTALVDDRTASATGERIEYAAETSVTLPGARRTGAIWRVLAARSRIATDVADRPRTALVGRDLERSILLSAFDRAVRDSSVQLVTLIGEPGIGKSRLVAELAARLDDRDGLINWRHGRCLPYGDGISFWALAEIVKAQLGILESDAAAMAEAKLDAGLAHSIRDREWIRARLSSLLGIASPPATQEENFTAWRRFIEDIAASGPTVLAFEDLHWADDALLDFIEHLTDWATEVPLLLLSTARPEMFDRRPAFGQRARNSTTVELRSLSEEDTASLVQAVLAGTPIGSQTKRLVVERSGGNPLYAQEYVRLLRDRSLLDQPQAELPFPETVESLIAARLDTLAPLEKAVVHDASVIGKVFWAGGVEAIGGGEPAAVGDALHDVSRRDFIRAARTSSLADEAEFSFNHILVRDVSYGQIPKRQRADKHLATARWLESRVAGREEDLADVLAYHFGEALALSSTDAGGGLGAGLVDKARHYLVLAGDRALSLDVARAERSYERALALAGEGTPERLAILERWAVAAGQGRRLHEAVAALREVIAASRSSGDLMAAGRALTAVSRILARLGDPATDAAIDEAVAVLEQEPASSDLVDAYAELSAADAGRGDLTRAILDADRALGLARELGLPEHPRALGFKGLFRCLTGDATGLDDLQRAVALALNSGLGREAAVMYANLAFVAGVLEGSSRAIEANRLAFDFVERTGRVDMAVNIAANHVYWLYVTGSWDEALARARADAAVASGTGSVELRLVRSVEALVLANRGEAEQATGLAEWLVDESRKSSEVQWIVPGFSVGALVAAAAGRSEQALALLSELEQHPGARADSNQYLMRVAENVRTALAGGDVAMARRLTEGVEASFPMQENFLLAARAAIAEAEGSVGEAARHFAEASAGWIRFENIPELAFARLGQGRCMLSVGDTPAALAVLAEARTIFDRLGARPALDEIDRLLGDRSSQPP